MVVYQCDVNSVHVKNGTQRQVKQRNFMKIRTTKFTRTGCLIIPCC